MSASSNVSTHSSSSLWAVVPAAGTGSRFGAGRPKQYVDLQGQPIAQRTLQTLQQSGLFAGIIVAVNPADHYFEQLPIASEPTIERIDGGGSRAASVLNGLQALATRAQANDWVMVHDIARPLISLASLQKLQARVVHNAADIDGAILAAPVYDTVKQLPAELSQQDPLSDTVQPSDGVQRSDAVLCIEKTLDRSQLRTAQTPQMFRYQPLVAALVDAIAAGYTVTDEASAMERMGARVAVVSNTVRNIKITTADDLRLAEFYLAGESQ